MATHTEIGPPSGGGPRKLETHGRIDIDADGDVAYWLKVLDTTRGELMAAIAKVGDDSARVAEYLKRGSDAEPPGTSQLPDGG
jgi:hypothetical protein